MTRDEVLSKVQKLLAKARSGSGATEAEMETAMAMARKLLLDHGLSMDEASTTTSRERPSYEEGGGVLHSGELPPHSIYIMRVIDRCFFVKTLVYNRSKKAKVAFFGDRVNVETARFVYHFLGVQYQSLWNIRSVEMCWSVNNKRNYYKGLTEGLIRKIEQERVSEKEKNAIQRFSRDVDNAFDKAYPDVSSMKHNPERGEAESYANGLLDGSKIKIARQISSTPQRKRIS